METAPLIKMLNDIGTFYETMPDHSIAVADMAGHIRAFWEPRMRESIARYLQHYPDGQSPEGQINDFALKAFNYLLKNLS
ncbi:MAG: formate dehydrogenase subunit delta [Alcaligenaceae bacterium]|nr:formate dehydrogenase subunit delta [Alcaligenaceae bacterium]